MHRQWLTPILLACVVATSSACRGGSSLTAERLENAIGPAFANLVHVQLTRMHMPAPEPKQIRVVTRCHRGAGTTTAGAGEWICLMLWNGPNGKGSLRDAFDVDVRPGGCYTARAEEGEESRLGGATLVGAGGERVKNLLHVFEGCFDPL